MRLIITRGLPASGKTTWARQEVAGSDGRIIRVSKDDLRAMLHGGIYTLANERIVCAARDTLVREALAAGLSVIVDDTNGNPANEQRLRYIAKQVELAVIRAVHVQVREFAVAVEECVRRDADRSPSVGEQVIRQMHEQWFA